MNVMVCELSQFFKKPNYSLKKKKPTPNYLEAVRLPVIMHFPSLSHPRLVQGWSACFYSYFLFSHLY